MANAFPFSEVNDKNQHIVNYPPTAHGFLSFSTDYLTPPASLSECSSRRGSEASFDSAYSTSYDTMTTFPQFRLHGCDQGSQSVYSASGPAQLTKRQADVLEHSQQQVIEHFGACPSIVWAPTVSSSSPRFGGSYDSDFATTGWVSTDLQEAPGPLTLERPSADTTALAFDFNLSTSPNFAAHQAEFSGISYLSESALPSSPLTILPSQTLVRPETPAANLDTPFESPSKMSRASSPAGSPELPRKLHPIDSYYHSDRKVVAVSFKSSDDNKYSEIPWQESSPLEHKQNPTMTRPKQADSRRQSSHTRNWSQADSSTGYLTRELKTDCVAAKAAKAKKYPCDICPHLGFDRLEHRTRHIESKAHYEMEKKLRKVPRAEPKRYPCHVCDKPLTRQDNMKQHLRTHLSGKNKAKSTLSIEDSIKYGLQHLDPRLNPDVLKKTPRKKARAH